MFWKSASSNVGRMFGSDTAGTSHATFALVLLLSPVGCIAFSPRRDPFPSLKLRRYVVSILFYTHSRVFLLLCVFIAATKNFSFLVFFINFAVYLR